MRKLFLLIPVAVLTLAVVIGLAVRFVGKQQVIIAPSPVVRQEQPAPTLGLPPQPIRISPIPPPSPPNKLRDTVIAVVRLTKSGLGETVILKYASAHVSSPTLTAEEIAYLRANGVSQSVIDILCQPATRLYRVEFTIRAPNAHRVSLSGEFNNWSPTATPMHMGPNGTWSATLQLAARQYQYKFVVDDNWIPDPENPRQQDDTYGGKNSVVVIGQ